MIVDILSLAVGIWALGAFAVWLAALVIYVADDRSPDTARPLMHSAPVWPFVPIKFTLDIARKEDR